MPGSHTCDLHFYTHNASNNFCNTCIWKNAHFIWSIVAHCRPAEQKEQLLPDVVRSRSAASSTPSSGQTSASAVRLGEKGKCKDTATFSSLSFEGCYDSLKLISRVTVMRSTVSRPLLWCILKREWRERKIWIMRTRHECCTWSTFLHMSVRQRRLSWIRSSDWWNGNDGGNHVTCRDRIRRLCVYVVTFPHHWLKHLSFFCPFVSCVAMHSNLCTYLWRNKSLTRHEIKEET